MGEPLEKKRCSICKGQVMMYISKVFRVRVIFLDICPCYRRICMRGRSSGTSTDSDLFDDWPPAGAMHAVERVVHFVNVGRGLARGPLGERKEKSLVAVASLSFPTWALLK